MLNNLILLKILKIKSKKKTVFHLSKQILKFEDKELDEIELLLIITTKKKQLLI